MIYETDTLALAKFQFPVTLIWELTNQCRSNCIYCSGSFPEKQNCGEMTYAEKKRLVAELAENRLFGINISGGEPFLSDDLLWITDELTAAGVKIMLVTSGLIHDDEKIRKLVSNPDVSFTVSLDSFRNEINDLHRGVLQSADRVRSFLEKISGERTYIALECVLTKKNRMDIADYLQETAAYPVSEVRFQAAVPVSRKMYDSGLCLNDGEVRSAAAEVERLAPLTTHTRIRFVDQSGMIRNGYRKARNWGGIIAPDGTLRVNAYLPFEYGRISDYGSFLSAWKQGFSHAWDYEPLHRLIADVHSVGDIAELCRRLEYSTTHIAL